MVEDRVLHRQDCERGRRLSAYGFKGYFCTPKLSKTIATDRPYGQSNQLFRALYASEGCVFVQAWPTFGLRDKSDASAAKHFCRSDTICFDITSVGNPATCRRLSTPTLFQIFRNELSKYIPVQMRVSVFVYLSTLAMSAVRNIFRIHVVGFLACLMVFLRMALCVYDHFDG